MSSTNGTYVPAWNTLQKAEVDLRDTVLLSSAFRMCLGLKEVIIGNGKSTTIPSYCFDYCQSLERVSLCDDITMIYEYSFRFCYRLRNITIPTSVTSIGSYAFQDCRRLHDIYIPGTVKTVSSYAFQNCMALKSAHLGSGVQTIGSNLFYNCYHLEEANLPNTIKTLNSSVFYQCYALKEIVFPAGITSIPSSICQSCCALKTVILPEGITQISSSAFTACPSLRFVGIPKSVTLIYENAFSNCFGLRNAVIGMGVKEIRASAFQNTYGLEYIVLPPSVTTLGIRAFGYSRSLKNLVVPAHLETVSGGIVACEIPSRQTEEYYQNILDNTSEIRESAFDTCRTIENAAIPEVITAIGGSAFQYNYQLKKAELPIGLLTIGNYAFRYDYQLGTISFPVTLTSIGQNAFEQCHSIEEVILPGSVRAVYSNAFLNCYGLRKLDIRANSMVLNGAAFSGCFRLMELTFFPGVTAITLSSGVFQNTALESVRNLPQKVTINSSSLFNTCYCLEEIDLTNAIFENLNVGNSMFTNCSALDEVSLPGDMQAVGSNMFQYCYALKHITLGKGLTAIYSNAFYECRNLEFVEFQGNLLTNIQSQAFYYCWQLKEIRIPYSVTSMAQCFGNCLALHDVYMYPLAAPTGTTSLGAMADGYIIHVPKGYLESYQKQWTGHAGHFEEFEYMIADRPSVKRTVNISSVSVEVKNAFVHTAFDEGQEFEITYTYDGTNLAAISNLHFDYEASVISFDFERAEDFDYSAIETMQIHIEVVGKDISCDFSVMLRYIDHDVIAQYEVTHPGGYQFVLRDDDFYESTNKGINSSFSLAKVIFTANTGKLYVDCMGQGETNCDFGIVSNLDCTLQSNTNADSGATVKKSFVGYGSYNMTLEYDIDDTEEHFIYLKYRKDGSVHTGTDNFKFRIRFESE